MPTEPITSATPPAGEPVTPPAQAATTPTPAPQAGDGDEPLSLDEARKLRRENQTLRQRQKTIDEKAAADEAAKLSETERLTKQYAEQQEINEKLAIALFERDVHEEVAQYASELNFLDGIPSKILARLLDWDEIEEENGKPTNIKKLLSALAKAVPVLVKQQQAAPGQPGTPTLPAMNPGRSSIVQPGQQTPWRKPDLNNIQWKS